MTVIDEIEYLSHYGILRRSGRYPWGSGDNVTQRSQSFLDIVGEQKKQGLSEVEIARGHGMSTTDLRQVRSMSRTIIRQAKQAEVNRLRYDKGWSWTAIAERMGINESSVRALANPAAQERTDILKTTTDMLRRQSAEKPFLDVGKGVENSIGISQQKLSTSLAMLKEEGYTVHNVPIPQLGTGHDTTTKVLCPPGTTQRDAFLNRYNIRQIQEFSDDGGRTNYGLIPPTSINPKRVGINYAEDGGSKADGVIYVRPGVPDVSLGGKNYAQVRVKVGDGHYMKGMAMYKEGLPEGHDLVFNTNKPRSEGMFGVLKGLSDDPDNPFGAVIQRQIGEKNEKGEVTKLTSVMNLVNEEGDWADWSKTLSAQVLSKQSPQLAKTQLDMDYERKVNDFKDISSLTNPVVKKKLLETFGDGCDSDAVHLKAAALPRQAWHAILPIESLKPTEVYAPNYENGERVILIRYPHGGTFEIPELTVNNKQHEARKLLGNAPDAVGINSEVARRLSGADFDGDTVLVIPNKHGQVKTTPALADLKDFDPIRDYKLPDDAPRITSATKQKEMGKVSNLIADMTVKGAEHYEIAAAVKHSMVVIDAEKWHLDYKRSAVEQGIPSLKKKYQGGSNAGASTLITRSGAKVFIDKRKARPAGEGGPINKETGAREYVPSGQMRTDKKGNKVPKQERAKRMSLTEDARALLSDTPSRMELLYADHANRLKALGNRARLEAVHTPRQNTSPSARKAYPREVASLDSKLALAKKGAPLERQAQIFAGSVVRQRKESNPNMDEATLKKIKAQALNHARIRTGAKRYQPVITQEEWNAIQAGAVSDSKLKELLNYADLEAVRKLATPTRTKMMTPTYVRRAKAMLELGYTRAQVAEQLGVSLTTLDTGVKA